MMKLIGVFNARGMDRLHDSTANVITERQKDIIILDEQKISAGDTKAVSRRHLAQAHLASHAVPATLSAPCAPALQIRSRGPLL